MYRKYMLPHGQLSFGILHQLNLIDSFFLIIMNHENNTEVFYFKFYPKKNCFLMSSIIVTYYNEHYLNLIDHQL